MTQAATPFTAPAPVKPVEPSFKSRVVSGSVWTLAGYGGSQVLRVGSNLILTRLLFPEAFGTMALVSIFVSGLAMFSDIGIGPSIIRAKRGDDANFLNTAWTIQVIRGFLLWFASILIAWPVAQFYNEPTFVWMIPLVGFTAVVAGLSSTRVFTLRRDLMLGRLTMIDLFSQVLAMSVTVGWAWRDPSVVALAAGSIAGAVLKTVLSYVWLPGIPNRFAWDKSALASLTSFGKWIFVSTLLTFLVSQSDRMIFGKLVPLDVLGVYSIAVMMALAPTQAIVKVAGPITMSVYSRSFRTSMESLRNDFGRMRFPITMAGGWAVSAMIVAAPWLMDVLYDERYTEAGWMIQLLVIAVWFEILETTNGSALLAIGQPRWIAFGNAAKLVGIVTLLPVGFYFHGFAGAITGLIVAEMARYVVSATAIRSQGLHVLSGDLFACAMVALTSIGALLLGRLLTTQFQWPAAIVVVLLLALISVAWAPMGLKFLKILRPVKA